MNKGNSEIQASPFFGGTPKGAELCKEGIRSPSLRDSLKFWFRAMMGRGK